jgi:hypothetical protein
MSEGFEATIAHELQGGFSDNGPNQNCSGVACGVGIAVRFEAAKVQVTCLADKAVITLPLLTSICRLPYMTPPISSPFHLCTDTPAPVAQL